MVLKIENCKIRRENENELFVEYWYEGRRAGYVAWLHRWHGGNLPFGALGLVSDGWIVVLNNGVGYLFQRHEEEDVVARSYIAEKFGLDDEEAEFFAKVLAKCWECQVV